ncbi:hypothetical protein DPMN_098360 [Dreissena polymorpha]|uniref:Uncharacterized protein n=1 Tax=Dreissena polymorpha TaxID=45954 RepID=A0A9D4LF27_DREPO|nr:hypothetical protein DPMN_098360 [Dreissena polymorpha]
MDHYWLHTQTLNYNTLSPSIKTNTMKGLRLTEDGSLLATYTDPELQHLESINKDQHNEGTMPD